MSGATAAIDPSLGPRRGQQSHALPSRSQSTRNRSSAVAPSPGRANSSYSRPSSSTRPVEDVLPNRDYETSNVATTSRRRSTDRVPPVRNESTRSASGHHRVSSRADSRGHHQASEMAAGTTVANGPGPTQVPHGMESRHSSSAGKSGRSRTSIPAQTGEWILGKTIGAGSMGKVKLARRVEGGEQVAVKIVPRGPGNEENNNMSAADRQRAERSKEVRTAREAAIVTLLDHPYVCGMRDVVRTAHHWYMLFEYVNGGQMLDYIISHGRLKEKQARKFSRQIASALDYCHRNSIVHRDLKIENILISKTGDIKIIDFGLSNLFAPRRQLSTFCGSLYFAAPELLQAKPYTGPEVDVWSFGIVLYVLVCGKVPFDDQSMPALHAKIKKGLVDYPSWLSAECKNLISRMLVTDPAQRASLVEIMNHPWMTKGFGGPPENFLPFREPLQLPLDPEVVQAMTGFDFGSPELIWSQLTKILESEEYQRALQLSARDRDAQLPRDAEKKRGFGFDFYKRRSSTNSRDTLSAPSSEALHIGLDPVNAFNPLISIYYLVREKQERDRQAANPGATSMPRTPGEAPLQMPEIPSAPKAAYTNSGAYEMPGEKATGGRSRPRARTHGEDEVNDAMKEVKLGGNERTSPPQADLTSEQPVKKEGAAASILRRFSTRKRRDPEKTEKGERYYPPVVTVQSPNEPPTTLKKSFSVRKTRDRTRDDDQDSVKRSDSTQPPRADLLTPSAAGDVMHGKTGLGRSTSVASAEYRRRKEEEGAISRPPRVTYQEPPLTSGSDQSYTSEQRLTARESSREPGSRQGSTSRTPTTRAKSLGHARRESIQARRAMRAETRDPQAVEETDAEAADGDVQSSADIAKPVFLKGLFSVSTTSTKPVSVIRADLVRVLRQLGVQYSEIRGGFSCRHTPSIDLEKIVDPGPSTAPQSPNQRRRISFGGFNIGGGGQEKDREEFREAERPPQTPKTTRRFVPNSSYTNSDMSVDSLGGTGDRGGSSRRAVGETSTHVQSELGGNMIIEWEILIVKVPLLSLHGIQFKRVAGGTWQYKSMADQILKELNL